jgi:indolepyruvate ferredoxin oxidoreductase alpha subunit
MVLANEAVAYAFLRAGVKVVSGYPGTPSSEVIGSLLKMKDLDGTKAVDKEILSPHAGLKNPIDITVEGTRGRIPPGFGEDANGI